MASDEQPRLGFGTQLRSFGGVFWTANWMELVERFAYYGVRTVLPVFMVLGIQEGGPELTHIQKGTVFSIWALVQSFVPIFTGGFADRYGYKLNIGISTVLKIIGYLLMGYCVVIATWAGGGKPLAELRAQGGDITYGVFFAGAMFLALGTAIFKPGLQGLVSNQMPKQSASLGWGIFYQMVNIGGFVGPMLAGYLRVLAWTHVFVACAIGIALNFIPLFMFKEPARKELAAGAKGPRQLLADAVRGLLEPRLFFFTLAFAGFWLMFYQLFDILPNFIDDWIDSRGAASALVGVLGDGAVPRVHEGNLTQEWMINVNALLISILAFLVGFLTGRMRSLTAIIVGIAISAGGIYALGMSMSGWWILGSIGLFSLGEMAASPTKMRYLAGIAPPGKDGLYMGYANMTVGIGWSIGSIVAGEMYQRSGDKVELAKRYLVDHAGVASDKVASLDRTKVMEFFESTLGVDAWGARSLLWDKYEPYGMWQVFTLIGLGSMVLLIAYDWVVRQAAKDPNHSFNTRGIVWVRVALVPIVGAFVLATIFSFSTAVLVQAVMFGMLLIASFVQKPAPPSTDVQDRDSTDEQREAA